MKFAPSLLVLLLVSSTASSTASAFAFQSSASRAAVPASQRNHRVSFGILHSSSSPSSATESEAAVKGEQKTQELGLLTFDLDDTLYPIDRVQSEANDAFVKAMAKFGYTGLEPEDIVKTGKMIREEMSKTDPIDAATLTHTEIRELAIRKEMEKIILKRKLQETADDWATQVESLSPIIVASAKKWAKNAVSESVVQAVLSAWEMERHHAAERHLFPEVIDALKQIKKEHPNVIIGAVTDGRANPKLMTFTLAPYFDFCMSWEDEQGGRKQFFKELDSVDGQADLNWIYEAARHKYAVLKEASDGLLKKNADQDGKIPPLTYPDTYDDLAWLHVGDDLAFDVGGSAACGAKTILVELSKEYGQTAPYRFDTEIDQPSWATTTPTELIARIKMNEAAKEVVDKKIVSLEQLPVAINQILNPDY
mmetsp:Transcript_21292/g.60782  ORF Transcript_21292/g.60782 Transcript_21292/m.60782 type:complete len:423 (+) Transcript_21292:278-1546(+)|eukprot:CAMPEP_0119551348 /NCGR_PEP_ID=MMETSP1352-20130426/4625_1 /TAXON_ID=265584 /ORGANISM="Stauroneis constricta, Strain CCMP1120" /LENGTH=422 /DNA_ID=CAMNT_0007597383 /DNA_START=241 /DNA_END=1509 /DNA_ORIENTATION=-